MGYLTTTNPGPLYSFTVQSEQVTTGTPETVCNDLTQQAPGGCLMRWNDNVYRYGQFNSGVGTVASAAAGMMYWRTLTIGVAATTTPSWIFTSDVSDSLAPVNGGAGIAKGIITTAYYSWLGVGGTHLCQCAASVVTGDKLYGHATTDLILTRNAVATACPDVIYGVALETRGATVANQALSILQNLIW